MAGEDEDLIVNLNEDEEDQPEVKSAGTKPPPVPGPSAAPARVAPQQGLAELEKQVATERAERERMTNTARQIAAERDRAIAFAQQAEARGMSIYELNNENQIKATQDQMDAITAQQEAAYNDGDFKTVADLNRQLSKLGGDLSNLEREKVGLANHRAQLEARAEYARQNPLPRQQQPPSDPIERAVAGRTKETQAFLRKHPELIRGDGTLKRIAIEAHERALDEGHEIDSAGYFQFVESIIGGGGGNGAEVRHRPQNAPTTAAPVARGVAPGNGAVRADGSFVMTAKMRRLAEEQGVTPQEWAKNYVRLLAEGRVTPIT